MTTTVELIDSHCHLNRLDLSAFNHNMNEVLAIAKAHDVSYFLCVCVEEEDVPILYQLADHHPNVFISVGIHPNTPLQPPIHAQQLIDLAKHPSCIAIGETGLDYYRMESEQDLQIQRQQFREHIRAARISQKPLIIHTRQASEDTLLLMKEEKAQEIGGVMHCFAEDWAVAKQALDLNFYISFSGILTFKNASGLQEVAKKVPMDRILIETDSPYLAPVPFRGKENHPALVKYVAQQLAHLRGLDYETIAFETTKNFYDCFRLTRQKRT